MPLTLAESVRVIDATIAKSEQLNIKIATAVCDPGGRLIAFHRMDGAIWITVYRSQGKAVTSAAPRPPWRGPPRPQTFPR
jgi:uncharacterized protein GlcG (DUF336 family)